MTAMIFAIAGVWVFGSAAFFVALGLACKRQMPRPEAAYDEPLVPLFDAGGKSGLLSAQVAMHRD